MTLETGFVTSCGKKANDLFSMKGLDLTPASLLLSRISEPLALAASCTII